MIVIVGSFHQPSRYYMDPTLHTRVNRFYCITTNLFLVHTDIYIRRQQKRPDPRKVICSWCQRRLQSVVYVDIRVDCTDAGRLDGACKFSMWVLCCFFFFESILNHSMSMQIYIPVHDTVDNHWFLLVINMVDADCEIFDSNPHPQSKDRRKEHANASVKPK